MTKLPIVETHNGIHRGDPSNAAGSDETEAPNPPAPGAQRHEQPNKRRSREKRLGGRDENGTDRYLRVAAVAKEGGTAYRRLPRAWGCVGEEATGLDTRLDWSLELEDADLLMIASGAFIPVLVSWKGS